MELTVQNVYGLLLRSKLLPLEEARAMYTRWQDEARDGAGNLPRFTAWLVAHRYVTEYQASLLLRGHADGFFLGEYKVLERLGKGRMAGVYKAQHRLGQTVAIKVLPPSKAREPTLLARFRREARLALRLQHPNVVRAFQVGVADNLRYLVMEHLEGATLEEVLSARRQLLPAEAVRLVYQALLGLQHIHEQGLVHRDLKPSNLMLVPAPRDDSTLGCTVKVLDIGLGRALFAEGEARDSDLTTEGVLLGTPDYMSPEQARDPRAADVRSDVYSLGCVLYHALTGQPPFPDTNIISQMIRHATETPRPLADFNPAVPDGLQQIVNWMLAKDPTGRYPTPGRAAGALEVFLAADGAAPAPDPDPKMRSYLTWLEGEKTQDYPGLAEEGTAAPPAGKPSAGQPAAGAAPRKSKSKPALPQARPEPSAPPGPPRRQKKKRPDPPVHLEEAPAQPAAESPDVELVAMTPPGRTRRDLILFFVGVGGSLVAYAIGRGLAALFGRPRPKEQD